MQVIVTYQKGEFLDFDFVSENNHFHKHLDSEMLKKFPPIEMLYDLIEIYAITMEENSKCRSDQQLHIEKVLTLASELKKENPEEELDVPKDGSSK